MKYGMLAVMAVILILFTPMALCDVSADTEPEEEYTVYGYIVLITDERDNLPLSGVSVSLLLNTIVKVETETDENGRFEFTTTSKTGNLLLKKDGYAVKTLPSTMTSVNDMDGRNIIFDVNDVVPDTEGKYALSSDASGDHPIAMGTTVGDIYGQVKGNIGVSEIRLHNALVTLTSTTGRVFTAYTDSNGYFTIECPYGTYDLTVTCAGFDQPELVYADPSEQIPYEIVMTIHKTTVFMGLDLPHTLEVIGIVVITLIMCVAFLLYRMTQNKHSEIIAIDYPEEIEAIEDKDDEFKP